MKLTTPTKILLAGVCLVVSTAGFLIKLPSTFRHVDKELHSLFYFLAAAFLNVLFANRKLLRHIMIFIVLYVFGMAIEYAQEYSNKLLHKRIHGHYDIEDIESNLKGLIAFSAVWIVYSLVVYIYGKLKPPHSKQATQQVRDY
jgi:hypothetical protein